MAVAWGIQDEFEEAISTVQGGQRSIVLEQEQMLVDLLLKLLRDKPEPEWRTAAKLYAVLMLYADSPKTFQQQYRTSGRLSQKLLVMQEALKSIVNIEVRYNSTNSAREWRISAK